MESGLETCISKFPWDSGMHLIMSHRFLCVQVPQEADLLLQNICFSQSQSYFPFTWVRRKVSRMVGRQFTRKTEGKWLSSSSAFSLSTVSNILVVFIGSISVSFDLLFLADIPVEALVIFCIPCQVHLQFYFPFPSLHSRTTSIQFSQGTCPYFHCLWKCLCHWMAICWMPLCTFALVNVIMCILFCCLDKCSLYSHVCRCVMHVLHHV